MARSTLLAALVGLVVALVVGGAAHALPGDPPVAASAPADGAVVAPDPDGLEVEYPCPVYRAADVGSGLTLPGGPKDYGLTLASSSRRGADGRLGDAVALVRGSEIPGRAGQCAALLGAGGSARPQETPGTYWWQVWRLCSGCAAGYEVGPVRRLVVRAAVTPRLSLVGRAYAGLGVFVAVSLAGVPDRTPVEVQLRRGSAWSTIARTSVLRGSGEAVVVLPAGAQSLRARARIGSQEVVSRLLAVNVLPASAPAVALAEGPYRGAAGPGTASATFTIAERAIRGFAAKVPMLCPGVQAGQFTTQVGTASIARIAVAPDGSFVGAAKRSGSSIRVRGRLQGGTVTGGRIELSVGDCVGSIRFRARRA